MLKNTHGAFWTAPNCFVLFSAVCLLNTVASSKAASWLRLLPPKLSISLPILSRHYLPCFNINPLFYGNCLTRRFPCGRKGCFTILSICSGETNNWGFCFLPSPFLIPQCHSISRFRKHMTHFLELCHPALPASSFRRTDLSSDLI